MDNVQLYTELGVERHASKEDIKKAYRKMAMQHHPDKGGCEEKFKKLNKAYEVLSNDSARESYDQHGEEGVTQASSSGAATTGSDVFEMFTGVRTQTSQPQRGPPLTCTLKVDLSDIFTGLTRRLRLTRGITCTECTGKGGSKETLCSDCRGGGVCSVSRQIAPGVFQQLQYPCQPCAQTGRIIAEADKCRGCAGRKVVRQQKNLEVVIEKGIRHGQKIVFSGEGDETPGKLPGDIVIVIEVKDHPIFKRDGNHLFCNHTLTLQEALCGFAFTLQHLDGRKLVIASDASVVYSPGTLKVIREEGMPILRKGSDRGDLYIKFDVTFPRTLPLRAKKTLQTLLPGPSSDQERVLPEGPGVEHPVLSDVNVEAESRRLQQQRAVERRQAEFESSADLPDAGCRAQ